MEKEPTTLFRGIFVPISLASAPTLPRTITDPALLGEAVERKILSDLRSSLWSSLAGNNPSRANSWCADLDVVLNVSIALKLPNRNIFTQGEYASYLNLLSRKSRNLENKTTPVSQNRNIVSKLLHHNVQSMLSFFFSK